MNFLFVVWLGILFKPIQDGGESAAPTSFSPVTSANVGIKPQNFLTFSFNPFDRLVENFKFVPSASAKLLNLNQDHSKCWYQQKSRGVSRDSYIFWIFFW